MIKDKRFLINLSEDQAQALSFASELVSRLYMGQLDSLRVFSKTYEHYDEIDRLLNELRLVMRIVPELNGHTNTNSYWGISSPEISDRARTLFDIHQVIRHELWKEIPDAPKYITWASPAFQTDHSQALPKMEKQ